MKSIKVYLFASLMAMAASWSEVCAQTPPTAENSQPNTAETKAVLTPEQLALGKEIANLTGMRLQYDDIMNKFVDAMWQSGKKDAQVAPALEQILGMLKPELELLVEQMVSMTAQVFASKFSDDEMKKIITFFQGDIGKYYIQKQPEVLKKLVPVLNEWIRFTENYVNTRARAELAKKEIFIAIPRPETDKDEEKPVQVNKDKATPLPEPSPEHIALGRRIAVSSGITRSYDSLISQIVITTRDQLLRDPAFAEIENTIAIIDSVIVALNPEVDKLRDKIIDDTAVVLAQTLTLDSLKGIDAFFETETGKLYVEQQPKILDALMPEVDRWTKKIAQYINIRTRAELSKKELFFK